MLPHPQISAGCASKATWPSLSPWRTPTRTASPRLARTRAPGAACAPLRSDLRPALASSLPQEANVPRASPELPRDSRRPCRLSGSARSAVPPAQLFRRFPSAPSRDAGCKAGEYALPDRAKPSASRARQEVGNPFQILGTGGQPGFPSREQEVATTRPRGPGNQVRRALGSAADYNSQKPLRRQHSPCLGGPAPGPGWDRGYQCSRVSASAAHRPRGRTSHSCPRGSKASRRKGARTGSPYSPQTS